MVVPKRNWPTHGGYLNDQTAFNGACGIYKVNDGRSIAGKIFCKERLSLQNQIV